ncbi:MAG: TolC family protein, partial [Opitutales bacterium]|nr:TolC family protein [Opitutales bacterium]
DGLFTEASRTWTLAGNLAGPIYDFGKTRNRVRSAEAQLEMAEWNYRSIVRQAFRELKDSVTRVNFSNESVQSRTKQEQAWRRYLDISINRDESGYSDPIELLDAQRGHFAAELALVTAKLNRLTATVDLFRALGGGWDPNPASTEPAE